MIGLLNLIRSAEFLLWIGCGLLIDCL